jgi:hypothetical protein
VAHGTLLSPTQPTYLGVAAAPVAAASQMYYQRAGSAGIILRVINGSASPINLTAEVNRTVDGLAVPNEVIAVAAGATRMFQFDANFEQPPGTVDPGFVYLDFSAVTTVTVELIQPSSY